jgi:hypothetical protein
MYTGKERGKNALNSSDVTHNWQNVGQPPSKSGSGWGSLGFPPPGPIIPTVVSNEDGRLEVFGFAPDRNLRHIWQDGRLEAFVAWQDGALWHNWQTAPNNGWSGWFSLSQT